MNLKFIIGVSNSQEYFGDAEPSHAIIEIDRKLLAWIQKARKALKSLGASGIELFDYTPELKISEIDNPTETDLTDAENFHVDYMTLHVDDDSLHWEICEKHSGIIFDTRRIDYYELDENLKVLRTKPTLLPLMLDHLETESAKRLLNERLRTK